MPPPSSRMTKNQVRNIRYRPGKAEAEQQSDFDSDSEVEEVRKASNKSTPVRPAPNVARNDVGHRKLPPSRPLPARRQPEVDLEGFVTASESSDTADDSDQGRASGSSSEEEDESSSGGEEESSSSEEEQTPRLSAPRFISKSQRNKLQPAKDQIEDQSHTEEERRRREKADELLQAQIEKDKTLRLAGKKAWDDEDIDAQDDVDDTDDVDPEAEFAAWKLRELKRVRRDRLALIAKEEEREEVERRKNLSVEEREAEDQEFLQKQKAEQEGRGKMAYMQKYFHRGAFFQDDDQDEDVRAALSRDIAGAQFVDDTNKDTLPEYMRIRDMGLLGRKGRTKYRDLKTEDTGRFGDFTDRKQNFANVDDRFRPERDDLGGQERTGTNAAPVGSRRPREDDSEQRHEQKRSRYS